MELITIPTEHKDHFKTVDTRIFENPELSSVAVRSCPVRKAPNKDKIKDKVDHIDITVLY